MTGWMKYVREKAESRRNLGSDLENRVNDGVNTQREQSSSSRGRKRNAEVLDVGGPREQCSVVVVKVLGLC